MSLANVVITTVGTSLIRSNLDLLLTGRHRMEAGTEHERLLAAYRESDWSIVATELARFSASDPICGAEVNSLDSLVRNECITANSQIYLLNSDSDDGRNTASVLREHLLLRGFSRIDAVPIIDLQDQDARRFRTHGLRNLSKEVCRIVRNHSTRSCAINATGGYKAQIATALLLGQAIGVPVYYKHERFDEIISFPPMPVALDFEVWMLASGLLVSLSRKNQFAPFNEYSADWDPCYDFLVDRTTEVSPVRQCVVKYFNPDLPQQSRFRCVGDRLEGIYSNGTWTIKFLVLTSASNSSQTAALCAELNNWLEH